MWGVVWCLAVIALTVAGSHEDDITSEIGDRKVVDGTDAIARFLGFKCPKGHRCLPVLECLPCDYGSFKATEGSDLCEYCPSGCTTLRKGAESKRECVPKCPRGYEESECGKTCTKCNPGYFKNNWKNKKCKPCPKKSVWDKNMVGMTKKSQCFQYHNPHPTAGPTIPTVPTQSPDPECDNYRGDIVLAIDVSTSISAYDLEQLKHSIFNFIDEFDVSSGITQFGVFAFPGNENMPLRFFSDKMELTQAIYNISWSGEDITDLSTHLYELAYYLPYFDNNRASVLDTAIVITGSSSTNLSSTYMGASYLHHTADKVFVLGIGTVDPYELNLIASDEEYVAWAQDVSHLAEQMPLLTQDACRLFREEPDDDGDTTTLMPPTSGPTGCIVDGPCTEYDYTNIRLTLLHGTNCAKYCQCAPAAGSAGQNVNYYWVQQTCSEGTFFDINIEPPNCYNWGQCTENYHTSPPTAGPSLSTFTYRTPLTFPTTTPDPEQPGLNWCTPNDQCSGSEYEDTRLRPMYGTNCEKFCQCAYAEGSAATDVSYFWEEMSCPPETYFNVQLHTPVCDHAYNVECHICPMYNADIAIVIDASESIDETDFTTQLDFVNSIIDAFDFEHTRFAVVTIPVDEAQNAAIDFYSYTDKNSLQDAIGSISYNGGPTATADALNSLRSAIFDSESNRQDAADIAILVTGGVSRNPQATVTAAIDLQSTVTKVITVGFNEANRNELQAIANTEANVFYADTSDALSSLASGVQQTACGLPSTTAATTPTTISTGTTPTTMSSPSPTTMSMPPSTASSTMSMPPSTASSTMSMPPSTASSTMSMPPSTASSTVTDMVAPETPPFP